MVSEDSRIFFPGKNVSAPRTERHVEASFAIDKPCEVIANVRWNARYIEHLTRLESFLLIARTPRIVTALTLGRVPGDPPGFPANNQILFTELQVGPTVSIVTAAIDRGFGSGLITPPLDLPASGRRHPLYVRFRVCRELCFW